MSPAALTLRGVTGDRVYARVEFIQPERLTAVVGTPANAHTPAQRQRKTPGILLGTIPASGILDAMLPIDALPGSVPAAWLRVMPTFVTPSGTPVDGNELVLVVIN